MSIHRFVLTLALLLLVGGCSTDDREIQKANQTIARLQAEVQALQIQNETLRRHEEMLVGEIGFSQGCRFLISTCFGLDSVGAELVQQGYTSHGSPVFLAWVAFKLIFVPIFFLVVGATVMFIMNTWVFPSAFKQKEAYEVIEKAAAVSDENARKKRAALAEIQAKKEELKSREARIKDRRRRLWQYIKFKKSEAKDLEAYIVQLKNQVETLKIAKSVEEAFARRKRR